jgi:hypothetical protein
MRDPTTRIDLETEAAIEDTRLFLKSFVHGLMWEADSEWEWSELAYEILKALKHIQTHSPKWVAAAVGKPLMQAALVKKRNKKPTLRGRHVVIAAAAVRLMPKYRPSRSEATREIESASSIVCKALHRLGITMKEKTIQEIVLKHKETARLSLSPDEFYAGIPR